LLGLTPQQQTKIKGVLDASQKQIEEILTPAQRSRMQQLRDQSNSAQGGQGFSGPGGPMRPPQNGNQPQR
jgi:hypothetical protein